MLIVLLATLLPRHVPKPELLWLKVSLLLREPWSPETPLKQKKELQSEDPPMSEPQSPLCLRLLIIEDIPERQKLLQSLYRDHAWVLVHTAVRAIRLVAVYQFDLISLDFNLAGPDNGDAIASTLRDSHNADTPVLVHLMNPKGAELLQTISLTPPPFRWAS